MEAPTAKSSEAPGKKSNLSVEAAVRSAKAAKPNGVALGVRASTTPLPSKKRVEGQEASDLGSGKLRSSVCKQAVASSTAMPSRRNSTGSAGVAKESTVASKRVGGAGTFGAKASSTHEIRRTSLPTRASVTSEKKLSSPIPAVSPKTDSSGRKVSAKPVLSGSVSMKISSPASGGNGHAALRRATSQRSPAVLSSSKSGSLSSSSASEKRAVSGRKKVSTPESQDSRLIMLPQVEVKAGDDLRMDLRGHRVRSLTAKGLNLSSSLEFVYLRDNLLSSLEGIEILKRVKVLDLSFNEFKGPGFEPLGSCKALQQLYLAGNQITSLASLPELPNLEFLSIAQNRLKSLCMASQPRLQVLAGSKNKISTLKGFPHFPVLEHLRVEENPILEVPHLEAAAILLVGPTLKKFNDRDLSPDEVELAKHYPAHTALCIRDGWEFCRSELAADSTFRFLAERWKDNFPPGFVLKEASVDQPFEEDICHCHFVFANDPLSNKETKLKLKYQWFLGERTPTNFIPINDATDEVYWPKREDVSKFLKVECTPICEGLEYPPIYAVTSPVSAGTGYPKVLSISLQGDLVEGNTIKGHAKVAWCGGTPGKGVTSWLRRKWNSSPVVISGAEDEEYRLIIDDIGSSLVFMYTPVTQEGSKGEPQYAMTDFIRAAAPSVSEVHIVGELVEGNTIKGIGKYFGGKEGPSKFEWLRENKETCDQLLVSTGTTKYTLAKEDVGWRIVFCYIPVNFEGQEGAPVSSVTDIVKKAPPRASNLKIVGDLREGSKVTVTASVTGGTEGSSRVQWFKTSSMVFEAENGLEAVSTSKIAKAFRIPLGAVGYYLVAKFTPMAPDGESGESAYIISEKSVDTLPPSLNFLSITGDYCEGEMLTASYGYIGGHEGKSLYNWYLHENENETGVLIPEASGSLQFRVTKNAIEKFISFKCTPIRDDGTVGEPRPCFGQQRVHPASPKLLSLRILGDGVEGTTLSADKKYWGGDEGNSIFQWFLTGDDMMSHAIEGATSSSYTLSHEDIGFRVSVSCEPIRRDGTHGPTITSEQVGPIVPGSPVCKSLVLLGSMVEGERIGFNAEYFGGEKGSCMHEWYRVKRNGLKERLSSADYLDLTLADVERCIELVYTPMRKDGTKGPPRSIISNVIAPADPKGIKLTLHECIEDQEVVPEKSYYGGVEGDCKFVWYRINRKMDSNDLLNLSKTSEDAVIVGNRLTFTPSIEDVGSSLVLHWVPTRNDGKTGIPIAASSRSPVLPAPPVVSGVSVKEISQGMYVGEGKYYGGHEGSSIFSWYREFDDGSTILIDGAISSTYKVTELDYNCRLLFGYQPVRSDSVPGECKLSEHTDVILPACLELKMLSFTGKAIEGEMLTAVEIIPENKTQQHVWNKYRKEVRYQWFCSTVDDNHLFEHMPSQCSHSYKLRLEDVGRCLKCECYAIDVFGRSSAIVSTATAPILPGMPRISKLEIEGRGFHTNLYAVRGTYSGGREGKSKIQWLRSMVGSPDLISIPGETGRMYEANVDDVGYRLVAVYTPIREDGIEGESVSASTEPIAVEPDVYKEVKQKVELGSVKFEALCDKDQSQKKVPGVGNLERRILEVNKKRVKVVKPGSKASFPTTEIRGTYTPPFHVELYRNDQHRLKIVVDSEEEMDLMVQTRHMRDVIVLVIRGLAQRFNSTSLNSLLKIET